MFGEHGHRLQLEAVAIETLSEGSESDRAARDLSRLMELEYAQPEDASHVLYEIGSDDKGSPMAEEDVKAAQDEAARRRAFLDKEIALYAHGFTFVYEYRRAQRAALLEGRRRAREEAHEARMKSVEEPEDAQAAHQTADATRTPKPTLGSKRVPLPWPSATLTTPSTKKSAPRKSKSNAVPDKENIAPAPSVPTPIRCRNSRKRAAKRVAAPFNASWQSPVMNATDADLAHSNSMSSAFDAANLDFNAFALPVGASPQFVDAQRNRVVLSGHQPQNWCPTVIIPSPSQTVVQQRPVVPAIQHQGTQCVRVVYVNGRYEVVSPTPIQLHATRFQ